MDYRKIDPNFFLKLFIEFGTQPQGVSDIWGGGGGGGALRALSNKLCALLIV